MAVTLFGIAAAAWGLLMAVSPALQIRQMLRTRSSRDVSLSYFGVLLPGFVLWVAYGSARADWAIIVPNAVALCVGGSTIVVALRLRSARQTDTRQADTAARAAAPSPARDEAHGTPLAGQLSTGSDGGAGSGQRVPIPSRRIDHWR